MSKICNIQTDNEKGRDIVASMYNLTEYGNNDAKNSKRF